MNPDISKQVEAVTKMFSEGRTIRETVGISMAELDALYAVGYNKYRAGQFDEAEKTFAALCELDATNYRYWKALGSARQCLKDFDGARQAYVCSVQLKHDEPDAWYHMAECLIALDNRRGAFGALLAIDKFSPSSPFSAKAAELREKYALTDA